MNLNKDAFSHRHPVGPFNYFFNGEMAFWPRDERTETKTSSSSSGEKRRDYPYLEPGLTGAATLSPETLEWTFLSNSLLPGRDNTGRRIRCRKPLNIFPPTRPVPQKLERVSIKRRAEQGANFLRVCLPDVEVTSDIIRQQLFEDITLARKFEQFDPYSGNLLEVLTNTRDPRSISVLFPTGEVNCNLNSCLVNISDDRVIFSPRADSLWSFQTPIQHLVASTGFDVNNLAVRTFGDLQLFTVKYTDDDESLAINAHSAFARHSFAGESVVDMKFTSTLTNFLTIGHKGCLSESDISSGTQVSFKQLHQFGSPRPQETAPEFWRLSLDKSAHNRFVLSPQEALQFDIRTSLANNVLSLSAGKHVFTAIEDVQQENLLRLCSTSDIVWLDLRFPGKPLLSYAHGREYDQYLTTTTVNFQEQGPLTFLSCRNNGLITVYDVSHSSDSLIRLNQSPYEFSLTNLYDKHIGQQFLEGGIGLGLFRLSERGGIDYHEIRPDADQLERESVVRKSKEIIEMEAAAPNLREHNSMLGARNYTQVDKHEKYNALFNEGFLTKKPDEHSAESLDQMLQLFPHYMQNHELPFEHILTAYDIAFRSGSEPPCPGRADFLTENILNSGIAYEAWKEGRFAPDQIKAPWHRSIASTLERLDDDFRSDPEELMEHLQKFNLAGENVPEAVRKLERFACQQLVLDLSLSSDIFSEKKFCQPRGTDHSIETMTEALSLGAEPAPIEFGYLQPTVWRPRSDEIENAIPMQQPDIPLGVRLLLQEWDAGELEGDNHGEITGAEVLKSQSVVVHNQQPPAILTQTQDVLTDAFGSRPITKKKTTKKRLGGF